ncbi:hypothetical protein OAA64_01850 [bacterium]|nr:hypothetical protein [bacterium]
MGLIQVTERDNIIIVTVVGSKKTTHAKGSLTASAGTVNGTVSLFDDFSNSDIAKNHPFANYIDSSRAAHGGTVSATVTALNDIVNATPEVFIKGSSTIADLTGISSGDFGNDKGNKFVVATGTDEGISTQDKVSLNGSGQVILADDVIVSGNISVTGTVDGVDIANSVYDDADADARIAAANIEDLNDVPEIGTAGQVLAVNSGATALEYVAQSSGSASFSSDITLWQNSGKSFDFDGFGNSESNPNGIAFKPDGSKMFIVGKNDDEIKEFALSTAFDVTTATFTSGDSISSGGFTNPYGLNFSPDGTKFFVIDDANDRIKRHDLSTAWDTSTLSLNSNEGDITSDGVTNPRGVVFKTDGTKMFAVDRNTKDVSEFTLSTAWDLSTLSFVDATDIPTLTSESFNLSSLFIDSDGSKVFITDESERIYELSLSTAWDFSTASYVGVKSGFEPDSTFTAISYISSINKAFVIGDTSNKVYEYITGAVDHRSDNQTAFEVLTTSGGVFSGSTIESVGNITSGNQIRGVSIHTNNFTSDGSGRINHTGNSLFLSGGTNGYSSMNMGAYPFKSLESKKIWLGTSSKGTTAPATSLNTVGNDVGYGSSSSVHIGTPGPNSYLDVNGVTHLRATSNAYGKLTAKGLKDLVAHNGITATGSTVFNETFTESSDTSITSHTSDSGHTYSVLYDDTGGSPTLNVSGGNGYAQISANTNNEGVIVKSSSTTSGDYEIIWNVDWASILGNSHLANFVVGAIDADNYFWFTLASSLGNNCDLNKRASGSNTVLIDDFAACFGDNSISASTANVEVKFRNIGGKSYIYVNGTPVLFGYTIDGFPYGTAHSSGFGVGAHPSRANDEAWDWKFNSIVQKSIQASDFVLDEGLLVETGARVNGPLNINGAFTLPSADGSSSQVLQTDGSGVVTWATVSTEGNDTNLANTNLTLDTNRSIDLDGSALTIKEGTSQYQEALIVESGTVTVGAGDQQSGATLLLREEAQNGNNSIGIKSPDTLTSSVTYTLPGVDGSSGQFLKTNGSGTLSFASATPSITDGSITTTKIADNAVTEDKLHDTLLAEIDANTVKNTNVSTNLTATTDASQITINSSDGTNVVIAEASSSIAGVMTVAHHDKLDGIESGATTDQTKADINGLAITTVGALSSGSVSSDFGNINNGSSTLDTGAATVASLTLGSHTIDDIDVTAEFVDDDAHIMSSKAIGERFALKNADTTGSAVDIAGGALGSVPYQDGAGSTAFLAGNTTSTNKFLLSVGNDTDAAAPTFAAVTATDVGLGNVENTAISTFAGTSSITTVGTVGAGTWQGTAIASAYLDADTAHLSGTQTFSGAKTFSDSIQVDNINLDANTVSTTNTNGNLLLAANGTGFVELKGNTNAGAIRFNCEDNSHGVTIKGPAHSAQATYTLTLPTDDGTDGQVLKTDGSGVLDWVDQSTSGSNYATNALNTGQNILMTATISAGDDKIVDIMGNALAASNNANAKKLIGFHTGSNEIVLQGMVDAGGTISGASAGSPLWLGLSGVFSSAPPTVNDYYSRVVGYYIGSIGSAYVVYFDPSKDWIQIDV